MSHPTLPQDLIERALNGTASPEEFAQLEEILLHDRKARELYRRHVNLHCSLGRIYGAVAPANDPSPSSVPTEIVPLASEVVRSRPGGGGAGRFSWRALASCALAASLLLAALAWFGLQRPLDVGPPSAGPFLSARVLQTEGKTEVVAPGGEARLAAPGDTIPAGHVLRTGSEEGTAVVTLDHARLQLTADTVACFGARQAQDRLADPRVVVSQGVAWVEASRSAKGEPLVLVTPHAEIRAVESTFVSAVTPEGTMVEVETGRLELLRPCGGQSVELSTGSWAVCSAGAEDIVPQPAFRRVQEPEAIFKVPAEAAALAPDGYTLAVATRRAIELWDVRTVQVQASLVGGRLPPHVLAFSPDGKTLASGERSPFLEIWDVDRRELRRTFDPPNPQEKAWKLGFSSDGRWLAAVGLINVTRGAHVWDLQSGEPQPPQSIHNSQVKCVAAVPGGSLMAGGTNQGTILLWDAATGREHAVLSSGRKEALKILAVSPDGRWLAQPTAGGVLVWDLPGRRIARALDGLGRSFSSLTFSPDSQRLAVGGPTDVFVWDLTTGGRTASIKAGSTVHWVAFTGDGQGLLTMCHRGGPIKLWRMPES